MKVSFDIKLDAKHLFGFNIRQAYKGLQGFLSIALPIFLFAYGYMSIGKTELIYTLLYFGMGVVFLLYVPVSLWGRAKKIVIDETNALSKTLHYDFEEDKIKVAVEEESVEFAWANIYQMKTSGDMVLVFTNRINAYILPLDQLGDNYEALSKLAHGKLEKFRIKMK